MSFTTEGATGRYQTDYRNLFSWLRDQLKNHVCNTTPTETPNGEWQTVKVWSSGDDDDSTFLQLDDKTNPPLTNVTRRCLIDIGNLAVQKAKDIQQESGKEYGTMWLYIIGVIAICLTLLIVGTAAYHAYKKGWLNAGFWKNSPNTHARIEDGTHTQPLQNETNPLVDNSSQNLTYGNTNPDQGTEMQVIHAPPSSTMN
jgi:hypothetical protein